MKRRREIAATLLGLALAGCSESTLIRSYPPGAKVYVDNQYQGVTPCGVTVPRSKFTSNVQARLERDGYEPLTATLREHVCGGRVVGGIFTLGIVFIFKRPTCFVDPQDFALTALPSNTPAASSAAPAAHQATVEERLEHIKKLRDQGTITNQEYDHYRAEILKGL